MPLIDKMLDKAVGLLTGFDFWFVFVLLVIGVIGWRWVGATKRQQKTFARQIALTLVLAALATCGIIVHHWQFPKMVPFPKGSPGILVLAITGDDDKSSAQRDLVSALDTELAKAAPDQRIEVRAIQEIVGIAEGLDHAHVDARKIGRKSNALLVV